ncbi:MAG: helix-turn-helix domain-containing protein [Armatimonadetes bacterium]|nr:helix-turn-helix domain-containing protein [Armatimonadota bacterium]
MSEATPTGERLETALYACHTAPYTHLDLPDIVLPHWTISFVAEGRVRMCTGRRTYQVMPGDVMIHPPNVAFRETNPHTGLHLWFACAIKVHDPHPENLLDRYPLPPVVSLRGEQITAYRETFARLQSAHEAPASGVNRLRRAAYIAELFAQLIEAWEITGSVPRPDAIASPVGRFASVIAYLRANLSATVTRADLAHIACLHPTAFDRAFVRATGQTPLRLLSEMRLTEVRQRLESTDDTLETIAQATGLTDAAHLSRLFRARFGVTPGKWRQGVIRTKTGYLSPLSDK